MIVSVVSQKGGVGKSSISAALIRALIKRGKRVCAIDLDVQGSLTHLIAPTIDATRTTRWLAGVPVDPVVISSNLSCFGATAKLNSLEQDYVKVPGGANVLQRRLARMKRNFDVVVIDTAAGLGGWVVAAMYAADHIVSPCLLEPLSLDALKGFVKVRNQVVDASGHMVKTWIVPNRFDRRIRGQTHILQALIGMNLGEVTPPIPTCSAVNNAMSALNFVDALSLGRAEAYFDHLSLQLLQANNAVNSTLVSKDSTIVNV